MEILHIGHYPSVFITFVSWYSQVLKTHWILSELLKHHTEDITVPGTLL